MGNAFMPFFEPPPNLKIEILTIFLVCFTLVGHPNFQTASLYDVGKWVRIHVSQSVTCTSALYILINCKTKLLILKQIESVIISFIVFSIMEYYYRIFV